MSTKKRKFVKDENSPWCFYCDRSFKDDRTLIQHQKSKHFKCSRCHKKLGSAPGMATHCRLVHLFTITEVPNSIPGRESLDYKIVAMDGIPSEFLQERAQKRLKGLLEQYGQQVASEDDEDDDEGNNLGVAKDSLTTATTAMATANIEKSNVTPFGNGIDNSAKSGSTDEGNRSSVHQNDFSFTGRTQMVILEDGSRLFYGEDSISPEERRLSDILNKTTTTTH